VLASSQGAAWTCNGFSTVWHRFKTRPEAEALIAPGLTLKGLRHTVATTLREAGLDARRIAGLSGRRPLSMARHFSRSANLADNIHATTATLEIATARQATSAKPVPEKRQTRSK
jgi:site-specific recombinase XerD